MTGVEGITLVVVAAVVVVGLVSNFSAKLGVAAPLALVAVGVVLSVVPGTPTIEVSPEVVLTVVLPPLLYATALRVPYVDFRRNLKVIASLAVVLVALSTAVAAAVVHWGLPSVGIWLALALGAVVSPPDAVAAIALGKQLGLPPRVMSIMEGEGLVNDATALVLLSTALGVVTGETDHVGIWSVVGAFTWAVIGAVLVGLVVGVVVVWVRARIADPVLDIAVALVVPNVTYLLGEEVSASGVVAVVVAGILVGNRGTAAIPASRRRAELTNWSTFTMLMENAVFLYMGYLLLPVAHHVGTGAALRHVVVIGILTSLALVVVRFAYLPPVLVDMRRSARRRFGRHIERAQRLQEISETPEALDNPRYQRRIDAVRARLERQRFDITAERDQRLGWKDSVVLGLGGMRGVVTIAAAQTLPTDDANYPSLVLVAFVVALSTLVSQGLALPFVVRGLHLDSDGDDDERREYAELMQAMNDVAHQVVEREIATGDVDPVIQEGFRIRLRDQERRVEALGRRQEDDLSRQFRRLRGAQLQAEKDALAAERRRGEYSSEAVALAQRVLDDQEIQLEQLDPGR